MRRFLPFLAVLVLLVAAAPALADGPNRGGEGNRGKDSEEASSHGSDHGGNVAVGAFQVQATSHDVKGDYVAFTYDASGIHGFSAGSTPLFDASVPASDAGGEPEASAHGAMISVHEPNFEFVAHDNPTAVARLQTERPAVLTFASGVTLTPRGDGRAAFTVGNLSGEVRGEDLQVSGQIVHATKDVLVYLDQPAGSFDLHRSDISDAIGDGAIGAEATFNRNGTGEVSQDVVSYGNVTMTTMKAEKGNITLLVEGHGTSGRVLVLNVDNGVLGAERKESLNVLLDNQTVKPADNLTDALNPDNDGLQPEYYVVFDPGANAFQMIVSVPHYSVHTLSVVTTIEELPPSVVAGAVLGVVLLVPSAFVLFRRPKA